MRLDDIEAAPPGSRIASIGVFALLMLSATLLIHLFATPELPLGRLSAHAATIAAIYTLGFAIAYLPAMALWSSRRPGESPPLAFLILVAACGLFAGFLLLASVPALHLSVPDGGHRDPLWMLRLLPVGAVIVGLYLVSERTRQIRAELARLSGAAATVARRHTHDRIELNDGRTMALVDADDILFAAAQENYCEISIQGGRKILIRSTLAELLERLPKPPFARTHRSYLVNLDHALSIGPSGRAYCARIAGTGEPVPVSRSYVEAVARNWRSLGGVDC